ncbi:MAG TPA: DUF4401 domain-containing protein [Dongiaceae bacterium]|nr:DUF4401 domain-containing protein [Dongiaceae bacterium]
MTDLSAFCARTGIDETAARAALDGRRRDDAPWYMQLVLGIGAWITAIATLFFVGIFMDLVLDINEPDLVIAVIGALIFGASLWLLRHRPHGAFTAHAAVAFAIAGTVLAAAGVGMPAESLGWATVTTLPFAAAAIWQQRSSLLQFLVVSVTLILVTVAAWDHWDKLLVDLPAIFVPFGVGLLLYPPRYDVRPAALAMLILPLGFDIVASDLGGGTALWFGRPAQGLMLLVFAFLFALNWRRVTDRQGRLLSLIAAIAMAVVTFLLPLGASIALVLLALAYTLGSRMLAVLGALLEIYFIWSFYWNLDESLLIKSIILMAAGAVLLLCYGLLIGALRERRAS